MRLTGENKMRIDAEKVKQMANDIMGATDPLYAHIGRLEREKAEIVSDMKTFLVSCPWDCVDPIWESRLEALIRKAEGKE
jgi:hypothetical protein